MILSQTPPTNEQREKFREIERALHFYAVENAKFLCTPKGLSESYESFPLPAAEQQTLPYLNLPPE